MSKNIQQIYLSNPATTFQSTDLMYLGRSPYGVSNDMGFAFSTLQQYIPFSVNNDVTGTSINLVANQSFIADNASLVTFTLPATCAQGSYIEIVGNGAGGFTIHQLANQQINFGSLSSTLGVGGSISSTNRYDSIRLICVVQNNIFNVVSSIGNLTVV